ncbi:MAG: Hsp70 family protein [Nitrospirae bacterium]|nr:Hsp70 family protein [Nitrospirota bacterium]
MSTTETTPHEEISCIRDTFNAVKNITDIHDKKRILVRCINCIKEIPKTYESMSAYQLCVSLANSVKSPSDRKALLLVIAGEIPRDPEFSSLYAAVMKDAVLASNNIEDPKTRKDSLLKIADEIQEKQSLHPLYVQAISNAIKAANEIKDSQHRIHALLTIATDLPKTHELNPLRLNAFKHALNLSTTINQVSQATYYDRKLLDEIARTLPKSCDYAFYRQYTLLGIAKEIPKTGEFLTLYKDAIKLAIAAATTIDEPYYRKYALCYIADEVRSTHELYPLYKETVKEAFKASAEIVSPLAKIHALIEMLKDFAKNPDFFPQIQYALKNILEFYSISKMIKELSPMEIIDFILVAEDKGVIKDSTKSKNTKLKYGEMLAKELEIIGPMLNDIRLIDILKPYTHIWIQPKDLRDAVSTIVDRLEELKKRFHGKEILKPVFSHEHFTSRREQAIENMSVKVEEKSCISIDIGATNTVIMRKKKGVQPEYVTLKSISRQLNGVSIVPSILSPKSDIIGAAAVNTSDNDVIINFKKMLLENQKESKKYMEKFLTILHQHLRDEVYTTSKWMTMLSGFSGGISDKLYTTVPIGFPGYKRSVREILGRIMKGTEIEILEEPLAAAIGYQMADQKDKIVLIIDFGGSTLDTMILRLNINNVHVIAKPDRSKMLGGHDIDIWLAGYLGEKLGHGGDKPSPELIKKAEDIKISLSDKNEAVFTWNGTDICKINRKVFEEVLNNHDFYKGVDQSISYILWKAEKVGIKKDKIEAILLTGGSSQIPSFKEKVSSLFPRLEENNSIYNHSPFSAVAMGAAMFASRNISDKHLGLAYAIKYQTEDKQVPPAYEIIFEKGEAYPFEKTFRINPARTVGEQNEMFLELFEIPEKNITRRWEKQGGVEFIKQVMKPEEDMALKELKIITLQLDETIDEEVHVTFTLNDSGQIKIKYGKNHREVDTGIRLQ